MLIILFSLLNHRSSRSQMFFKIDALKNFANFTGKQLCWSLFLIKLRAWGPAWCKSGTRTPKHWTWDPLQSLKVELQDPLQSLKKKTSPFFNDFLFLEFFFFFFFLIYFFSSFLNNKHHNIRPFLVA